MTDRLRSLQELVAEKRAAKATRLEQARGDAAKRLMTRQGDLDEEAAMMAELAPIVNRPRVVKSHAPRGRRPGLDPQLNLRHLRHELALEQAVGSWKRFGPCDAWLFWSKQAAATAVLPSTP